MEIISFSFRMYIFEEIPQIEDWFILDDKKPICKIDLFERYDIGMERLWNLLNRLQIIAIARGNKNAAYMAYAENFGGFRKLCNKAWNNRILDLSDVPIESVDDYFFVRDMFPNTTKLVLARNIPTGLFGLIDQSFERMDINVYNELELVQRDYYPKLKSLSIRDCSESQIDYSIANILSIFYRVRELRLYNVFLSSRLFRILDLSMFNSITIVNSDTNWGGCATIWRVLLNPRSRIRELHIMLNERSHNMIMTSEYILCHIKSMPYLTCLSICFPLTRLFLSQLLEGKSLKKVTIYEMGTTHYYTYDRVINRKLAYKIINRRRDWSVKIVNYKPDMMRGKSVNMELSQ